MDGLNVSKLIVKTIESPDGTPVAFTNGIVQVSNHVNDLNVHLTPSDRSTIAALTGVVVSTADINSVINKAPTASPAFTGTVSGVTKAMVGLSNADNTTDLDKPISGSTQTALNGKANIASPTLTGVPSAPTALANTNNTQIATTAFVNTASANAVASAQAASTPIAHVGTGGTAHANVSTIVAGFMSASDKVKLDAVSGTNTGDQTTITGNAGSATALQTARTINGVTFDGSANISINAVDSTARIASSLIGAANGVAPLDADSKIAAAYLPAYVDDVLEVANYAALPITGETGKIYVDLATNKAYRWSGSTYVYITSGAVDSVAGKTGVVTLVKADVGLGNVDNTADASKPVSTAQQTALDLKLNSSSYTAADVLSKLVTVDGSGSGLDADTLDGINSAGFLQPSNYGAYSTFSGTISNPAVSFSGLAPANSLLVASDGTTTINNRTMDDIESLIWMGV